ncbi:HAD-IA family hydrolase [Amnibacterium sp. CER49]|uniref:HAD-IA family hydrolase n=1 Tax=Amnibacterium sp. CER49 TaxID=3039161 RepID=UPI00244C2586|nr:HAD-IA family hydrolase [Amnibacterium sp. CER49]MDH2443702.1 HAD-IA family hydrolase [Amnibacterium sp. CER49]
MPPVRWLLLDIGGVLELVDDGDWPRRYRDRWAARLGLTPEEFDRRRAGAHLPDSTTRSGVEQEWWTRLGTAVGASGPLLVEMRADFWDAYCGTANTELLAALAALRGRVGLAILSNSGDGAREEEERRYGFSRLFAPIRYSHETGVVKPSPEAFTSALDALGAAPQEVLLVDDAPANVDAARALGIRAHLHEDNPGTLAAIHAALADR